MKKLLIATSNPGKFQEYKLIFKDFGLNLDLVSLNNLGIKEAPEETGKTFEKNAIIKAKFYYERSGIPTLADDGGIEIDYLNGEPGIKSRRWPGHEATDEELIRMTLEKLKGVSREERGAQLRAAIAIIFSENEINVFEGILRGIIIDGKPTKIIPGYPFRSILYIPEKRKILADFSQEEELEISHRKKALEKALPILKPGL